MQYDFIPGTKVRDFNRLNSSKELLSIEHQARAKDSILFTHYETLKSWRRSQAEDKFFDLDIEKRRLKKEKAELELLTMENDFREKIGLGTFESYQAFLDREENDEEPNIEEEILLEAANILSDFIEHSYNPVISMNKAG